jgi:hypothetical protein
MKPTQGNRIALLALAMVLAVVSLFVSWGVVRIPLRSSAGLAPMKMQEATIEVTAHGSLFTVGGFEVPGWVPTAILLLGLGWRMGGDWGWRNPPRMAVLWALMLAGLLVLPRISPMVVTGSLGLGTLLHFMALGIGLYLCRRSAAA